jgi:hypothetical protein
VELSHPNHKKLLRMAAFWLVACLSVVAIPSPAHAEDLNAGLSSAEERAAGAEVEISDAQKRLMPAEARYAAITHKAIPARANARSARLQVHQLRTAAAERQRGAATRISRIEADHQQKVDEHDEQLRGGVGLGLAALLAAAIAMSWGWFRASAAVAWLTRLSAGQSVGLCVSGAFVMLIVGGALSTGSGVRGGLGAFLVLLAPVLAVALVLARHSAEVQSGRAKPLLKRERLPRGVQRSAAAALLLVCLVGFGAAIFASAPAATAISTQLHRQAAGGQTIASKRALAAAVAKAGRLGAIASRLSAKQRTAGEALRRSEKRLRQAESLLADARRKVGYYTHRMAVLEKKELEELERAQRRAAREAKEEATEEAPPGCDPNYTPCVPETGYDVDCSEVAGPVEVIGTDVDGLDADNDGIGCES